MRLRNADHRSRVDRSHAFACLMFCRRIKAAVKLITEDPLSPHSLVETPEQMDEWTVLDELRSKHPEGKPASQNYIVDESPNDDVFHPVIFDNLDGKPSEKSSCEYRPLLAHLASMPLDGTECVHPF